MTCLVYHINEGLCIVPRQAANGIMHTLAREDPFDQGGEFIQDKVTSNQTS